MGGCRGTKQIRVVKGDLHEREHLSRDMKGVRRNYGDIQEEDFREKKGQGS